MTPQEKVQALQRAINLIAEIEIKSKYSEVIVEAFSHIKKVGESILDEAAAGNETKVVSNE
jgi:hypothetical protein